MNGDHTGDEIKKEAASQVPGEGGEREGIFGGRHTSLMWEGKKKGTIWYSIGLLRGKSRF